MQYISKSVEETEEIAKIFINDFILPEKSREKAFVVGLYGDLGAGKTTFMKYLAKNLDVKETIQSPTFVIMKKYDLSVEKTGLRDTSKEESKKKESDLSYLVPRTSYCYLYHIDAYRIESNDEMLKLGWNEIISNPKNIIFVEWPEIIKDIMPSHTKIFFEHLSENERKIKIIQ
jgi:tRNA threonylcarbamoyladenosine biosynthesis protein TsaE